MQEARLVPETFEPRLRQVPTDCHWSGGLEWRQACLDAHAPLETEMLSVPLGSEESLTDGVPEQTRKASALTRGLWRDMARFWQAGDRAKRVWLCPAGEDEVAVAGAGRARNEGEADGGRPAGAESKWS